MKQTLILRPLCQLCRKNYVYCEFVRKVQDHRIRIVTCKECRERHGWPLDDPLDDYRVVDPVPDDRLEWK